MSRSLELSEWMSSGAPEPGPHPRHTPLRALAIRGFHESDHALNFSGLFRGNFFGSKVLSRFIVMGASCLTAHHASVTLSQGRRR